MEKTNIPNEWPKKRQVRYEDVKRSMGLDGKIVETEKNVRYDREDEAYNQALVDCLIAHNKIVATLKNGAQFRRAEALQKLLIGEEQKVNELTNLLRAFIEKPKHILSIMEKNDIKIDNLDDKMQKFAFTVYSELIEIASKSEQAIS